MSTLEAARTPTSTRTSTSTVHRTGRRWPARGRSPGRGTRYPALAPVRVSRAPHPRGARLSWWRVAVWLVLASLVVPVLVAVRASGSVGVPESTAVVQVRAGESLSEVAARVAPGVPTTAVVQRIVSLNGLPDASVRTGETLVVPHG